jgi:hypothetical protein
MSDELGELAEHQPTRRPEVIARLDQIIIGNRLAEWADAIREAFIGEQPPTACDQPGLDAIHDRLDDLCRLLEKHLKAPRRWTITVARWSITITKE